MLKRVVLAEVTEDKVIGKYLNTADEELLKIEEKIEFPSNRKLKEINDLAAKYYNKLSDEDKRKFQWSFIVRYISSSWLMNKEEW